MLLRFPAHPELKRIVVLNPKGGAGKTTIATGIAGYLAMRGERVALMDTDPQGSSMRWLSRRPESSPPIVGIQAWQLNPNVTRSFQLRVPPEVRYLVVDTPASLPAQRLQELTPGAHAIIVPVLPSDIDMHAATVLISDLLLQAKVSRSNGRLGVIANRVRNQTIGARRLDAFLNQLAIRRVTRLGDSQAYLRAAESGLCLHEMPRHRVSKEIEKWQALTAWLDNRLEVPLTARDWLASSDESATRTREAGLYDVARAWERTAPGSSS
jgi:chromosome partitioning protein